MSCLNSSSLAKQNVREHALRMLIPMYVIYLNAVTFVIIKVNNEGDPFFYHVLLCYTQNLLLKTFPRTCINYFLIEITQLRSFYFLCRAPNQDTVLIIHTKSGVFSSKKLLHTNEKQSGSRLIRKDISNVPTLPSQYSETSSAARCLIYKKIETKV